MVIDASSRVCFRSAFGRPPAPVIPGLLTQRSPPRLLTAAARTGLGPAPESRSRWARHHLPRSCTSRLFVHFENSFPCVCGTRPHTHRLSNISQHQLDSFGRGSGSASPGHRSAVDPQGRSFASASNCAIFARIQTAIHKGSHLSMKSAAYRKVRAKYAL
jgi:hypothetical protein